LLPTGSGTQSAPRNLGENFDDIRVLGSLWSKPGALPVRNLASAIGPTLAAAGVSAFDIADEMGNSPEECMRRYIHTHSEGARDRVRRAVAEAARRAS
jgi:hypothetical protein